MNNFRSLIGLVLICTVLLISPVLASCEEELINVESASLALGSFENVFGDIANSRITPSIGGIHIGWDWGVIKPGFAKLKSTVAQIPYTDKKLVNSLCQLIAKPEEEIEDTVVKQIISAFVFTDVVKSQLENKEIDTGVTKLKTNTQDHLTQLPEELLIVIFQNLNIAQLSSVACVSEKCAIITRDDEFVKSRKTVALDIRKHLISHKNTYAITTTFPLNVERTDATLDSVVIRLFKIIEKVDGKKIYSSRLNGLGASVVINEEYCSSFCVAA